MNLLLDTHAFLWFIGGDKQLPEKSIELIKNPENNCFISIASLWEIAIKYSLRKIELINGFEELYKILQFSVIEILPISFDHLKELAKLDFHHRDPFDRIIISQGISEELTVITKDDNFGKYKVPIVWN
jgi:PIN domain nuclease of toxin-antitoxin system